MISTSAHLFLKQISQIFSVDKLPLGFLLGAGCPVSVKIPSEGDCSAFAPIIPDVEGLTTVVIADLKSQLEVEPALQKMLDVLKEDGLENPNIEKILGFVRTLAAAAGTGVVRGFNADVLKTMDQCICASIFDKVNKTLPAQGTAYHALAQFAAPRTKNPIEIFTTNYDLLMEQALESSRVPYFDGFVGSCLPFFDLIAIDQDVLPSRWVRLWKIHGSINWRRHPNDSGRICRTLNEKSGGELLIHPSHQKFDDSRRMPYLAMIDRLKSFIRNDQRPVALIIQGYSFSDDHLNAAIEESLRSNPHAACFSFQFGDENAYPGAKKMASRCSNVTILARDGVISKGVSRQWEVAQSPSYQSIEGFFDWDQGALEGQSAGTDAKCCLGDFDKFGQFLRSLTGEETISSAMVAA